MEEEGTDSKSEKDEKTKVEKVIEMKNDIR